MDHLSDSKHDLYAEDAASSSKSSLETEPNAVATCDWMEKPAVKEDWQTRRVGSQSPSIRDEKKAGPRLTLRSENELNEASVDIVVF